MRVPHQIINPPCLILESDLFYKLITLRNIATVKFCEADLFKNFPETSSACHTLKWRVNSVRCLLAVVFFTGVLTSINHGVGLCPCQLSVHIFRMSKHLFWISRMGVVISVLRSADTETLPCTGHCPAVILWGWFWAPPRSADKCSHSPRSLTQTAAAPVPSDSRGLILSAAPSCLTPCISHLVLPSQVFTGHPLCNYRGLRNGSDPSSAREGLLQ